MGRARTYTFTEEGSLQRRSFLAGAATANVAGGVFQSFVARLYGQGKAAIQPAVNPVGAGQDRLGKPHQMGFSSLLFKVLPGETGDGLFLIELRASLRAVRRCTCTVNKGDGSMLWKAK